MPKKTQAIEEENSHISDEDEAKFIETLTWLVNQISEEIEKPNEKNE